MGPRQAPPVPGKPATLAFLPFQIIFKVCLGAWNKLIALEANPAHNSLGLSLLSLSPATSSDIYKRIYFTKAFSSLPSSFDSVPA